MAKLKGRGQLSGRVGGLVYVTVNGVTIVRAPPSWKGKYKPTEKQVLNQKKFKFAMRLMRDFRDLLNITFETKSGETTSSSAMKTLLNDAIIGEHPNLSVDYSKLLVAKGSLPPATGARMESTKQGVLQFHWTADKDSLDNHRYDNSILVSYYAETNEILYNLNGPLREELTGSLTWPKFAWGKEMHCWIAFRSKDFKLRSDSVYAGMMAPMK